MKTYRDSFLGRLIAAGAWNSERENWKQRALSAEQDYAAQIRQMRERAEWAEQEAATWREFTASEAARACEAEDTITRVRQVPAFTSDDGYEYVLADELYAALDNGPKDDQ